MASKTARVALFFSRKNCLKPARFLRKTPKFNGCLVGAYLFPGPGFRFPFSSFRFWGPPRGLIFFLWWRAPLFFRIFLKEARFFPGFRALLEDASITTAPPASEDPPSRPGPRCRTWPARSAGTSSAPPILNFGTFAVHFWNSIIAKRPRFAAWRSVENPR